MRFIQLTKYENDRDANRLSGASDEYSNSDDVGENVSDAQQRATALQALPTIPVSLDPDALRDFHPRRNGNPGTRINFKGGGGYVVLQSYDEVKNAIRSGGLDS